MAVALGWGGRYVVDGGVWVSDSYSAVGGLVIRVLKQGLSILSVGAALQQGIKGLVLLLAVAFGFSRRRSAR